MSWLTDDPRHVLSLLGGFLLFYFAVTKFSNFLYWCYAHLIRSGKNLRLYGEWAIVTGATDGIGKAYCFELAKQGIKILLISRNEAKLQAVEKELQEAFPKVQFDHLAIDFSTFDAQKREMVRSKAEGLDVGVLINNVGLAGDLPKYYHESTQDEISRMVEVNINSVLWMTKILLGDEKKGMIARKRGAIVNIGSGAGRICSPLMTLYGASKTYVNMFSRSLHAELAANYGIHVSVQMPSRVISQLTAIFATESLFFPTAETWAKSAIRFIGYESWTHAYWPHEIQHWAFDQVPPARWNKDFVESHLAIREMALKKMAEHEASADGGNLEMPLVSVKGASSSPGND